MSKEYLNLTNHFLIALLPMDDPNFRQSVTYICEHNENGALGIVINRPTDLMLADVLTQMEISLENEQIGHLPILFGGPVHQERGFVIHRPFGIWKSSYEAADDIVVTTSRDILQAIAENKGPSQAVITLGYAGWGSGQLEKELEKNLWLTCPASPAILFEIPYEQRWVRSAMMMGVDIFSVAGYTGHG